MKTVQLLDVGDKVYIKMIVAKREFTDKGDIQYMLKDPRRAGRLMDYPFTSEDLEVVPISEELVEAGE